MVERLKDVKPLFTAEQREAVRLLELQLDHVIQHQDDLQEEAMSQLNATETKAS